MSELPKGWATSKLPELISCDGVISDGDWIESKDQDPDGNIRLIQLADIGDGKFINKSSRFMNEEKASLLRCTFLEEGDVLIARMPDPLGRACIFPNIDSKAVTVVDICLIRVGSKAGVTNHLLKYWFNTPIIRSQIAMLATGTTRKRITRKKLADLQLPVPPYNEQIRIANKLDSILAKVDKAQARLDKIPAILKRFRQSVLAAATSGELTKEWRGNKGIETWTFPKIKEVGKVQLGRQRSPKYHTGENMKPYLRVQNVFENLIDISDVMEMDFSEADFQRYQLHDGDILLNEGQSPKFLGRPAIYRDELEGACFTNTLIRFQANELTTPEFALIVFRNHMHSGRYIEEGTITTNLAHLGAGRFSNVEFPLPPISEQAQIVQRAEKMLSKANKVEKQYLDAKARLDRLTQSILAKAFRGELVPQDPTDEPAEQLLERILKEREQAKPKKKATKKRVAKVKTVEKG